MYEDNLKKPFYSAAKGIDRLDHAFWQHLTTFTVGLGITGTKDPALGAPPSGGWPAPVADGATAVDDLWHAAVNGRGKYLSASNPQEFQDALDETLNEIFASQTAPSGVAVSSFVITSGSKKYVPSFSQPQWIGDITAYDMSTGSTGGIVCKASEQLPAANLRNIFIWNGASAVEFNNTLSTDMRAAALWNLAADAPDSLINFLRGDRSLEGNGYRCRGDMPGTTVCSVRKTGEENRGLLGDVVNSMPTLIKGNVDLSYEFLPSSAAGRSTYRSFVSSKKKRSVGALFVGANDGMLHAFDDSNGKEVFAFIPQAVMGNLARLADINYGGTTDEVATNSHRYFVDGPMTESDAYLGSTWTNVLVGSTGAGGKSVFALKMDTTTPTSLNANSVMWEIN
ncbi:MAG TPA: PilC/PilY family type IV pilus protein, partial [Aquabacterium sp.]|nr:PilC/PilY family type IV pilus protein [Aquabacterium sp.]